MKRLVWLLVLPCLVIAEDPFAAISGQMQAGMTFYGLQSPIYTPQGKQIAQVTSGKARMRNATSADVEYLLVEFYQEQNRSLRLYTPEALLQFIEEGGQRSVRIESDAVVLIESAQATLYGKGFVFDPVAMQLSIKADAKLWAPSEGVDQLQVNF